MTWNNVQAPYNTCVHCAQSSQYHGNHLGPTLPHAAYLHPQVAILCQLLSMVPTDVAIGRTADINEKASVSLLVSETDVRSVGFDLPCSGDGRIPHHHDVIRLHKPIRLMTVPPVSHWNLKMLTNVRVDDEGNLIVSVSVVRWCHSTIACHNVFDCLQTCTAHVASGTDIPM